MRPFFIFAFTLIGGIGPGLCAQATSGPDTPKSAAEDRLAKSAAVLRTFREGTPDAARTLFDRALCIGVAPRRDPAESAAGEKGFVTCRPGQAGAWSDPAAIAIAGGGIFWPVAGATIDVIMFATDQSTASHFRDAEVVLGANPRTIPGPVRPDRIPLPGNDPVIFAYELSEEGITGIDIAGATLREDKTTNTVLYGRERNNSAILTQNSGERNPIAVGLFLAALPSSGTGQSGKAIAQSLGP